ncbi:ATP-binding cassette domain-containing protein [Falsihalocynthiibacter arcticus]|uniref:ABC transporter ATP-binding protein n=1 Tax=Falsihalocynthiibacter arcticus TaxID=1579316 RepID=A0A126V0N0_9RHOB|nr:ATP-binding cassette domain-containing protein [Falsihalocynthiibacter arcticus]AML51891.1 ABC transporter ATP-binding protein [Falsihalocynthiibacter arcticus]
MIKIENLTVQKGGSTILTDVSLKFGQGGITALIGPNGAGKSTLLNAIAGLIAPKMGTVEVEGLNMARARAPERAHRVALLAQNEHVTARLTVRDLVGFGRWAHHQGRPSEKDHHKIAEAIASFDLGELAERRLDSLSGGQRQRAFVAMAWAQETPWMLLDEPLSALDPRHVRDIMDRLYILTRPSIGQRSVVIVLHDLGIAARYADRIVALKDGQLITSGPRGLTMTGRMLSDLFGTNLSIERVAGRDVVVPV